jgi:hypothetical protein
MKKRKEKNVHKIGSFALTAMLLLSVFAVFPVPAAASGEIVSIGSAYDVASGSTITVPVSIANVTEITGLSANLVYDTSVVTVASITANNSVFTSSVTVGGPEGNKVIALTNTEAPNYITTTEDTPIIDVTFNVGGTPSSSTTLDLQNVMLTDSGFDTFPPETVNEGEVTVEGEAPAEVVVVINEFSSYNTSGDWIELYNKETSEIPLDGWSINDSTGEIKAFTSSDSISAGDYLVVDVSNRLNQGDDTIKLLNSSGVTVDQVTYGSGADEAPAPGEGNSTGRYPNGVDTDNDAEDFEEFGTPTPGASNEVPDTTPPTITAVLPEDGATDVPVSTTISATFSEAMNETSAEAAFSITPTVAGTFSWDGNTMTFTPDAYLAFSTEYTVTIAATATDLAGNGLDGNENGTADGSPTDDYNWSFSTGIDTTSPEIFNLQPADGSFINATTPTISANYSDSSGINVSSVEMRVDGGIVTPDSVTETGVSYIPATDLSEGLHTVTVNVSDNVVSPNTNSTSWSFTVDITEPTIEFVDPTPDNNEEVTVNYVNVTVNVTDNFDLTQAVGILWWNGTETDPMTKIMYALNNKSQFYFKKTNLANGDYTYKVYANDTAGNMNVSETRVVTVNVTEVYPGDFNDDGYVNIDDVVYIVVNLWGPCTPGAPGDFTNDGYVNIDDVVYLVVNLWGPCP